MSSKNDNILIRRVLKCRKRLKLAGIKMPRHFFSLKYPEYKDDQDKLNNLWYGKVENDEFTKKLESFTTFKEIQYK